MTSKLFGSAMLKSGEIVKALEQSVITNAENFADAADAVIGAFIDIKVLSEVPLFKTGLAVLHFRDAVQQHLFTRNCAAFLEACRGADSEQQSAMFAALWREDKAEDFADSILLLLTQAEKPLKTTIAGRLVAALARGELAYVHFLQLIHIVYSASMTALWALPDVCERNGGRMRLHDDRSMEGLLVSVGVSLRHGNAWILTTLGMLLYKFGFNGGIADEAELERMVAAEVERLHSQNF